MQIAGLRYRGSAVSSSCVNNYTMLFRICDSILSSARLNCVLLLFDGRSIVWWERNDDDGWGWTEGEDIIDQLIGIREELMRGDNRALFLGWLADFDPDEWQDPKDGSALMPPIPADLNQLSAPLTALTHLDFHKCNAINVQGFSGTKINHFKSVIRSRGTSDILIFCIHE
jgi:hypothetical protein